MTIIKKYKHSLWVVLLALLLFSAPMSGILTALGQKSKGGPLPSPNVKGLPLFLKLLTFARSNIAEGDFEAAVLNLHDAKKIHPNDPMLHELYGLAYDGGRFSKKALVHFLKAGELFFKEGNMDKSWKMLGWMNTIDSKNKKVLAFEKKIRKKQLEINLLKEKKKKKN